METLAQENKEDKTLSNEFRTSVTVNRVDFNLFKEICKAKYEKDPVNTGIKEAISDFNKKNRKYLDPTYNRMKELME